MNAVILSSIGGLISLAGAVVFISRAIFNQVNSTDKNTAAIKELSGKIEVVIYRVNGYETRIAILEDRIKRMDGK